MKSNDNSGLEAISGMTAANDMPELKPCPFCGRPGQLLKNADHHGEFFYLGCAVGTNALSDKCKGSNLFYTSPIEELDEAIEQWNTRPAPAAKVGDDDDGLHSKIDMDIEDEIGREITLEESRLIGLAVSKIKAALTAQPEPVEGLSRALDYLDQHGKFFNPHDRKLVHKAARRYLALTTSADKGV